MLNKFEVEKRLNEGGIENSRFEAKELVNSFSGEELEKAVNRRLKGEPLQYILGEWEFYSLPFFVGSGVLIPRPETELLVDLILENLKDNQTVIDLCSGSGGVAVAVAKNSGANVYALEKYPNAINYLEKNIALNNAKVNVIKEDIFNFDPNVKFDIIASNPPYIKSGDLAFLQKEVQFEPMTALDGGEDGLMFYRHIATLKKHLNKGGKIMVEVGYDIVSEVENLFKAEGLVTTTHKDLNGVQRVIIGTLPY